jgi:hypothetical protein
MGQMRFLIPRPQRLEASAAEQAYLAGPEGIPWECSTTISGDELIIERDTRESGYLYFPWLVSGRGLVQLCSGSLMERPKAYHLSVELARGTLNRLRNQASQWQAAGMNIPAQFYELLHTATGAFSLAATGQEYPLLAEDYADEAIRLGLEAGDLLGGEYTQQVLALRRGQQAGLGTLFAARLQAPLSGRDESRFLGAFNTAVIGLHWPEIEPEQGKFRWEATDALVEWCQARNLRVCMGPLLQMEKHTLPDWLYLEEGFDEIQGAVLDFVAAVTRRYRGKVQLWHVAARMNLEGSLAYSEEHRLRLLVEAVDRVRSVEGRVPLVVSFDQPWGEYIVRKDQELTAFHFADTLIRGDLGLAGIGLEINYGYWPGGTLPRDPLEVSRQLDRWMQLGVPLMVFVAAPSSSGPDRLARHPARPLPNLRLEGTTPAWQQSLVAWLLPLLLAKQSVQAIAWDGWQDALPHEMAHAGLCDAQGQPKPALQSITDIRREWIG